MVATRPYDVTVSPRSTTFSLGIFQKRNLVYEDMDQIRLGHYFKTSWSDGANGIVSRPLISLVVFALTFSAMLWLSELNEVQIAAKLVGKHVAGTFYLRESFAFILQTLGSVMLAVQVMRYSAYGEDVAGRSTYFSGVWRMWWRAVALGSVFFVLGLIAIAVPVTMLATPMAHGHGLLLIVATIASPILFCVLAVFVAVRLSVFYCSGALGEPLSVAGAWQMTKGRFWAIFGCNFVIVIPTYLILLLHYCIDLFMAPVLTHANLLLEKAAVGAIVAMLGTAAASACLALLYREFLLRANVSASDVAY
jgi:hypothetical protein